jgi:uncharacterized protein (DUF2147 family)
MQLDPRSTAGAGTSERNGMSEFARTSRAAAAKARKVALLAGTVLASCAAFAQTTPVGLWKVFDDDTGQATSLVRIADSGGVLSGRVERLLDPSMRNVRCDKCTDERKDKPVLGMTILRNVKRTGDGVWEDGDILDPDNGKVYRVRLKPLDGGKKLEVRGYLGPFYRNQRWLREE